jgi:hypothetical protein
VIVVALLAAIAAGVVAVLVLFGHRLSLRAAMALVAMLGLSSVIAFAHLRHAGLALATAVVPLSGLIAAASLGLFLGPLVLAYLTGLTIALFLADDIALRVVDGSGGADAAAETLRENAFAGAAAAISAAALATVMLLAGHRAATPLMAALDEAASGLSALIVLPLVASLLPYSEDFVSRANRLRELRERRTEKLAAVTEPRWGWSLTGIGVVFFALTFFGSRALHATEPVAHFALEIWCVAAVLVAGAALAVTRDWRRSLAATIALGLAALVGCWGYARAGISLNLASWLALMQVMGTGLALSLFVAQAARPDGGEDTTAASVRSLMGKTGVVAAATFCAIVVLLGLSLSIGREAIALTVALFFAGLGAVLLQPALTIAIETLAPRRSTIEARYRVN